MTRKERREYAKEFERICRQYESKYFPKIEKTLKRKISSLIDILNQAGPQAALSHLSTDIAGAELSSVVMKLYMEVGLRFARREYRRQRQEMQKKAFGHNAEWTSFILNYLSEFAGQKITFSVNATAREKLGEVLQDGIAEGLSIEQMVERLMGLHIVSDLEPIPWTKKQAARIVRTETTRAANTGTMATVDTAEYEMAKEWIAARDNRTRGNPVTGAKHHANHWALDGQVIDIDDKFIDARNGDRLSFPGDPEGSAASTINCRCTVAPTGKRDENENLIPKPQVGVAPVLGIFKPPIAASPNIGVRVSN